MIQNMILWMSLVLLIGCKGLEGTLLVDEAFSLKSNQNRIEEIDKGYYKTFIKTKKRKVELQLVNNEEVTRSFKFKTPDQFNWPQMGGEFEILSKDSEQPVHLKGYVEFMKKDLGVYKQNETCHYMKEEFECYQAGHRTECRWVNRPTLGSRDVEYHLIENRRTTFAFLENLSRSKVLSRFEAKEYWEDKEYIFEGRCF